MLRQWSPGGFTRVLRISDSAFYSQAFFTLHSSCFLKGFPGDDSSTSKSIGLHDDPQNIAPGQLFVWITVIHKRFICGGFYLRARACQVRNINFSRELVVWSISFEISASYEVWTLFAIGEYLKSSILYPFDHKA